jgi:hypothetical protein
MDGGDLTHGLTAVQPRLPTGYEGAWAPQPVLRLDNSLIVAFA